MGDRPRPDGPPAEVIQASEDIHATEDIRVVGVVGAGTMGAGIAQVAIEAGHTVRLYDADPAAGARAVERIADGLARRAAKRGDEMGDDVATTLRRLRIALTLDEAAEDADLVIEAAAEDLAVKRSLFERLDTATRPGATLATNTSSLSVGAIATATADPGRVVGLHFFNPAAVMLLVEVVSTPDVRPDVAERAVALMARWDKTPVRCADTPGFIVNRVNRPFTLEALRVVEEGQATVREVDDALRADGFPMGPFELMDLIGIDVNLAVARSLYEAFDHDERFRPSPLQERLVGVGGLGRKTGIGFHRYDPGSSVPVPAGVPRVDAAHSAEIVERVTLAVVNEAYRALGDGVATRADIDRALRLGAGHPLGPFERVADLGGPAVVAAHLDLLAERHGSRFEPAPALRSEARH
ncbi:MAG: 3-hydroxyacyl-CoA dehydrogenase NAD-binding domain-containing protein, partial [Candidatus Limnocylindrales bacterium]